LWLTVWTLTKLKKLLLSIGAPGSSVRYILCRWEDALKSTRSTLKKLPSFAWRKVGDSPQGSISTYSAMHGGLSPHEVDEIKNKQYKPVDNDNLEKRVREAGL